MTLRTKPLFTVSVVKKPDGRLALRYTRTAVPAPSETREEQGATPLREGTTRNEVVRTVEDGAHDGA